MDANIIQSFIILFIAVLILAGFLFFIKKNANKRNQNRIGINMKVISKISLQAKHHIFVVKVAEKVLVIGVSENNMNILTELDPEFVKSIESKSQEKIKNEVFSKINTSKNTEKNDAEMDLSFLNFIKSSLKLGN
ncbi:MAG: flagellar biosynthetic protein FliO [Ignavibacteria bacterium]|jgi:flagellar protein FliO/FliZ|nr:flagellar biosynthetic protein FliO [Ignavibacteria bacterium]